MQTLIDQRGSGSVWTPVRIEVRGFRVSGQADGGVSILILHNVNVVVGAVCSSGIETFIYHPEAIGRVAAMVGIRARP